MASVRVDPAIPVWVDPSRATGASRTLIGLRGPLGDQRMLVEIDDSGIVVLRRVDQVDAEQREGAEETEGTARIRRPSRAFSAATSAVLIAAMALVGLGLLTGLLRATVVQTESMVPTFRPGDVFIGITPSWREPAVGDVVLFTARRFDGTGVAPFTHRIVGGSPEEGFVTKGDNNPNADALDVRLEDIRSVRIATIRYGGLLVSLRPVFIALLAIALGLLLRGERRR